MRAWFSSIACCCAEDLAMRSLKPTARTGHSLRRTVRPDGIIGAALGFGGKEGDDEIDDEVLIV